MLWSEQEQSKRNQKSCSKAAEQTTAGDIKSFHTIKNAVVDPTVKGTSDRKLFFAKYTTIVQHLEDLSFSSHFRSCRYFSRSSRFCFYTHCVCFHFLLAVFDCYFPSMLLFDQPHSHVFLNFVPVFASCILIVFLSFLLFLLATFSMFS